MMDVIGFEKALIGTVLSDQKSFAEVLDIAPQDFEIRQHQVIWKHVMDLAPRGTLSHRSIAEALRATGDLDSLGGEKTRGEEYISELEDKADLTGLKEFSQRVREASAKRRLEKMGILLTQAARNGKTSDEIIEEHVQEVLQVKTTGYRKPKLIGNSIERARERIRKARAGELPEPLAPNITALKKLIPGYNDVDFAIYAATPGSGKSSLFRSEGHDYARQGKRILMFTYENTVDECQTWTIAKITGINHTKILFPKMLSEKENELVEKAWDELKTYHWLIEEMHGDPLATLAAIARRELLKEPLDIIMIDGMYLMGGPSQSKYEIISDNTQNLRSLAQEFHVPIIATTQFNRGVMAKKEPSQEDLLYAGENPARIIVSLTKRDISRDQAAKFKENWEDGRLMIGKNMNAVVIQGHILKQTNGKIGATDDIKWVKFNNRFETLVYEWDQDERREAVRAEAEKVVNTYPSNSPIRKRFNPKPKPEKA
jgi:replicative DNA helicase